MSDNTFQLYKPYKRLYDGPADIDSVFYSVEEARRYAESSLSYDGNVITIVTESSINLYMIKNGTLHQVPFKIVANNEDSCVKLDIQTDETGTTIIQPSLILSDKSDNVIEFDNKSALYVPKVNTDNFVSKYTENIYGDKKEFTIEHNLNSIDISVNVWSVSPKRELVICDVLIIDNNSISIKFDKKLMDKTYRVIVMG